MAKICPISKKTSSVKGGYSNATRATQFNPTGKRRQNPNIKKRRIFVPELNNGKGKYVSVKISARGLKTIQKNGAFKTLSAAGLL